jgi:6-phospho-beta-glucosidase
VLRVKAYERLVVETIRTHDRQMALRALEANPLVGPYLDPEPLLAALLEANRAFLPEFT